MIPTRAAFSSRSQLAECMDAPDCCEERLLRTVAQFDSVNRWVSRYRTVLRRWVVADMLSQPDRAYHVLDLGAGGCDIDAWFLHETRRHGLDVRVTACDVDPRIVRYAQSHFANTLGLNIRQLDALTATIDEPVDYVFAHHFLHHLSNEEIVVLLRRWGPRVRRRMVVSDLHRKRSAYLGFALFSCVYRKSFIREDGLISIRRGFRPPELDSLAHRAGVGQHTSVHLLTPGRVICLVEGTERPGRLG